MHRALLVVCLLAWLPHVSTAATPDPRPFDVRDLIEFDRLSEPDVSPDGRQVVFTVSALDLDANRRRSDLWVVATDGSRLRPLTRHADNDTSGTWSPDGKTVYFLSTRSGSSQVWKLPLDGGEAQQLTALPLDVGSFVLSPDGKSFALSMERASVSMTPPPARRPAKPTTDCSSVTGTPGPTGVAATSSSCLRRAARRWTS